MPTYLIKQSDEQTFCSASPQTQIESGDPSSIQCQLPSDYRWMAQALPILKAASHPKSLFCISTVGPPQWLSGEESACNAGDMGSIPGSGRPLEKEMATHSSILAWRIPWTEESGRLQFMELQRVRDDGSH